MTLASGAAIVVGSQARARLPQRTVRWAAAGAFLLLGIVLVVAGLQGQPTRAFGGGSGYVEGVEASPNGGLVCRGERVRR